MSSRTGTPQPWQNGQTANGGAAGGGNGGLQLPQGKGTSLLLRSTQLGSGYWSCEMYLGEGRGGTSEDEGRRFEGMIKVLLDLTRHMAAWE